MIGGESEIALRRAAAFGDGWCGRMYTPDSLRAHVGKLAALRSEYGREHLPFIIRNWIRPDATGADIRAQEDAGAHHVIVRMNEIREASAALAHIEHAAEAMLPR